MFCWVKKDLFGFVWKVWLYRRHSKSNQIIHITMTITTVLSIYAMHALFRFCILLTIEKTPKYFFQVPFDNSCFLEYEGVDWSWRVGEGDIIFSPWLRRSMGGGSMKPWRDIGMGVGSSFASLLGFDRFRLWDRAVKIFWR